MLHTASPSSATARRPLQTSADSKISADLRRNFTVKNFTDQPAEALVFDAAGKIQARFTVEPGSENTGTVVMPGAYVVRVSNKVTTLTQRFVMP